MKQKAEQLKNKLDELWAKQMDATQPSDDNYDELVIDLILQFASDVAKEQRTKIYYTFTTAISRGGNPILDLHELAELIKHSPLITEANKTDK